MFKLISCVIGCHDGDVRIADGRTSLEGRVEICAKNTWGTICDDGWGTQEARVVCRQLGLATPGRVFLFGRYIYGIIMICNNIAGATYTRSATFGQGVGLIALSNLQCTGMESRLLDCSSGAVSCIHSEDAGVRCLARTGTCILRQ